MPISGVSRRCPRQESNLRTRFRKPHRYREQPPFLSPFDGRFEPYSLWDVRAGSVLVPQNWSPIGRYWCATGLPRDEGPARSLA
jgi:hypothetical protein